MIKWYWDHQHYVQAISLAREWIVSWVMVFADEPKENLSDQDVRKKYEHELGRLVNVTETQTGELPEEPEVDLSGIPDEVIQIWRKVPQIRNDIDHAGYRKEPLEAKKLIAQAEKIITEIRKLPLPDKG